jgi:hypothetical protein
MCNAFFVKVVRVLGNDAIFFVCGEGSRSRSYGHTAVLRFIVQPCDEDEEKDDQFLNFYK